MVLRPLRGAKWGATGAAMGKAAWPVYVTADIALLRSDR